MVNPYFAFRRVDNFQYDMNKQDCFTVDDMDGTTPAYKFVLASQCSNDINKCIDSDGTLMEWDSETGKGVQILSSFGEDDGLVPLLFSRGINSEGRISVNATSVTYELTDEINHVKGIFLVSVGNGSGYVLAYSINNAPLEIPDDTLILNVAGMIWGSHYTSGE